MNSSGSSDVHEQGKTTVLTTDEPTTPAPKDSKPKNPNMPPLPPMISDPMAEKIMENCVVKGVMSGAMGAALGFAFGGFFAASMNPSVEEIQGKTVIRQVVDSFKQAGKSGWHMSKGFAVAGALFSGTECGMEWYRGKTDMYNSVTAGCISGAILGARGGPKAAGIGCAGFSAFSLAIDYFTGRHDSSQNIKHDDKWGS